MGRQFAPANQILLAAPAIGLLCVIVYVALLMPW
jgi:hypothetical protein